MTEIKEKYTKIHRCFLPRILMKWSFRDISRHFGTFRILGNALIEKGAQRFGLENIVREMPREENFSGKQKNCLEV